MDLSISTLILRICNVSPSARNYFDGAQSLVNVDDDETINSTDLNGVVEKFVDDLSDIGIDLHCTLNDLIVNLQTVDLFARLGEMIMPSSLYDTMKANPEIRDAIKNILQGSISDDPPIIPILQYFGYHNEVFSETCGPVADFFLDKITSTEVFINYLSNLITVDNKLSGMLDMSIDKAAQYIKYMSQNMGLLHSRISDVLDKIQDEQNYVPAGQLITQGTYALVSPMKLSQYAWIYLTPNDVELTGFEKELRVKYLDEIHKTILFYPEFYIARDQSINKVEILVLLGFASVMVHTKSAFEIQSITMAEKLVAAKVLNVARMERSTRAFNAPDIATYTYLSDLIRDVSNYGES